MQRRGQSMQITAQTEGRPTPESRRIWQMALIVGCRKMRSPRFPSPQPSPSGRGSHFDNLSANRERFEISLRGMRFPLSPRERAGVRGRGACSRPQTVPDNTIHRHRIGATGFNYAADRKPHTSRLIILCRTTILAFRQTESLGVFHSLRHCVNPSL